MTNDVSSKEGEYWKNRVVGMEVRLHDQRREFNALIDQLRGQIVSLVSDLGARDDFIQRLMQELSQHGWGDFHYGPQEQDRNIVALLEEGGFVKQHNCIQPIAYKVRRKNDGVEYGPFETLAEANVWVSEHNELIPIYPGYLLTRLPEND